jgi:3',5'-cyclic AMP phosphodiesterase CpdA
MMPAMRRAASISVVLLTALALSLHAPDLALPLKPDSVRFAVIGDMGTGKKPQYELAAMMVEYRRKFPFEFVTMLGDNIYDDDGDGAGGFEIRFERPYRPLLDAGVSFYAALGNHDKPNQRFYKPFNMDGQQYYTYKKGNVRFFVLDTNDMNPRQLAWLEKELRNAGSDWIICYFHHPLYTSGGYHDASKELRGVLEPLFVRYGVQVVFSGHNHVYERVKPQKGITYFTEGSSGSLRKGNLKKTALTAVGYDQDCTFMLVEIAGDELYYQTISRTGKTVDSGVIRRLATVSGMASWPAEVHGVPIVLSRNWR